MQWPSGSLRRRSFTPRSVRVVRSRGAGSGGSRGASRPPRRRERGSRRWRRRDEDTRRGPTPRTAASCLVAFPPLAAKPTGRGLGRRRDGALSAGRGRAGGREADERFPRRPASGGRRQRKRLGHDGFGGAQHRRDQRARVEVALAGGTHDAGQHLLGVGPPPGAVAAAHLAGDHRGADASWWLRHGSHKKRNTAGNQESASANGAGCRRAGRRVGRGQTPDATSVRRAGRAQPEGLSG